MSTRADVVEELKLTYEVPYVTGKGEVIDTLAVPISEERHGVSISYALVDYTEQRLHSQFPPEGVSSLARMLKRILRDLAVKPSRTVLQLWEHGSANSLYSVEGRAPVNGDRDTVLIILTKNPFVYKFEYELVLWHQAMHAKDRWERRFPAAHPLVNVGEWLDVLWHFSIDGRLEALGRPHYSRAERLEEAKRVMQSLCPGREPQVSVDKLCGELWGEEVTFAQLAGIGKSLGLEPVAEP